MRFLKWLLIILAVWAAVDLGLLGCLRREIVSHPVKTNRTAFTAVAADQDIIILGNSMARSGLNANRIADSLRLSTVNLGVNATGLRYAVTIMRELLHHHRPQVILLVINPITNGLPPEKIQHTFHQELKALYGCVSSELDAEIEECYPHQKYFFFSNALLMKPVFSHLIYDRLTSSRRDLNNGYDPFHPTSHLHNPSPAIVKPFSPETRQLLDSAMTMCRSSRTRLFFLIPPTFAIRDDEPPTITYLRQACRADTTRAAHYIHIQDADSSGLWLSHPERFNDIVHLNHDGAEIYTDTIISLLRRTINDELRTVGTGL